jgi:NAD(P)-dependent dehydrogenase (short-subunit alcohol dehydrogenase family)
MGKNLHRQVAIITGVSRSYGIGSSICRKLALSGSNLFLTGWPEYDQSQSSGIGDSELELLLKDLRTAGSDVEWMPLDLSLSESPVALLEAVSSRFGQAHVLINNACFWLGDSIPGPTDTGWMTQEKRKELLPRYSLGRLGEPEDAARLVAFLASPEADWITGQTIRSRGGFY